MLIQRTIYICISSLSNCNTAVYSLDQLVGTINTEITAIENESQEIEQCKQSDRNEDASQLKVKKKELLEKQKKNYEQLLTWKAIMSPLICMYPCQVWLRYWYAVLLHHITEYDNNNSNLCTTGKRQTRSSAAQVDEDDVILVFQEIIDDFKHVLSTMDLPVMCYYNIAQIYKNFQRWQQACEIYELVHI